MIAEKNGGVPPPLWGRLGGGGGGQAQPLILKSVLVELPPP